MFRGRQEINHIYFLVSAGQQILMSKVSGASGTHSGSPSAEFVNFYDMADIGAWTYTYMIWILIL